MEDSDTELIALPHSPNHVLISGQWRLEPGCRSGWAAWSCACLLKSKSCWDALGLIDLSLWTSRPPQSGKMLYKCKRNIRRKYTQSKQPIPSNMKSQNCKIAIRCMGCDLGMLISLASRNRKKHQLNHPCCLPRVYTLPYRLSDGVGARFHQEALTRGGAALLFLPAANQTPMVCIWGLGPVDASAMGWLYVCKGTIAINEWWWFPILKEDKRNSWRIRL